MKKVLLAVLALGMLASCSCRGLNASWHKSEAHGEQTRKITGFERIILQGSLDVKYKQADSFMVKVNAPVEVINDVETRVEGNVLKIRMKGEGKFLRFRLSDSDDVTVYVSSPDFLGVSLQGSGDFDCLGLLDTDNLDIEVQGSGDIDFDNIVCDKVDVSVLGSGDVELKKVKTQQSVNEVVGSGEIKIHYDNSGVVRSTIVGSGDITLSGQVKSSTHDVRGSGDMKTGGLTINP
jgi:hypothetical protein